MAAQTRNWCLRQAPAAHQPCPLSGSQPKPHDATQMHTKSRKSGPLVTPQHWQACSSLLVNAHPGGCKRHSHQAKCGCLGSACHSGLATALQWLAHDCQEPRGQHKQHAHHQCTCHTRSRQNTHGRKLLLLGGFAFKRATHSHTGPWEVGLWCRTDLQCPHRTTWRRARHTTCFRTWSGAWHQPPRPAAIDAALANRGSLQQTTLPYTQHAFGVSVVHCSRPLGHIYHDVLLASWSCTRTRAHTHTAWHSDTSLPTWCVPCTAGARVMPHNQKDTHTPPYGRQASMGTFECAGLPCGRWLQRRWHSRDCCISAACPAGAPTLAASPHTGQEWTRVNTFQNVE